MSQGSFHAIADAWSVPDPGKGKYSKKTWGKPLFRCRVTVDPKEGESSILKIRLENAKTHSLLAIAPYDGQNGVESVSDSARCYVLTLHNPAVDTWIGIGFRDPSDSIDFSLAIQSFMRRRMAEERLDAPGWSSRIMARYASKAAAAAGNGAPHEATLAPLLSPPLTEAGGSSPSSSSESSSPNESSSSNDSSSNEPSDEEEFGDFQS